MKDGQQTLLKSACIGQLYACYFVIQVDLALPVRDLFRAYFTQATTAVTRALRIPLLVCAVHSVEIKMLQENMLLEQSTSMFTFNTQHAIKWHIKVLINL